MRRLALAALAALLTACSAGVGGDWPDPRKGVLADCQTPGDRCGGTGWCGATEDDRLTCCPVPLRDGVYCPGTDPAVVECAVDVDCPREDCREAPHCMGGVCFAAVQAVRTYCAAGVCDEAGACVPCQEDADCEAVNATECHAYSCDAGSCVPHPKAEGEPCNITDGTCAPSAVCISRQ